jgi:DNA-binding NtrC family response regulator
MIRSEVAWLPPSKTVPVPRVGHLDVSVFRTWNRPNPHIDSSPTRPPFPRSQEQPVGEPALVISDQGRNRRGKKTSNARPACGPARRTGETVATIIDAPPAARVLLIEKEGRARAVIHRILETQDYTSAAVEGTYEATRELASQPYDVVLFDLEQIGLKGLREMLKARSVGPAVQFVAMAAEEARETAIEATRLGAFGFITRPFDSGHVVQLVQRAAKEAASRQMRVKQQLEHATAIRSRLIGNAAAMARMYQLIERVAPTRATVLITGETGTGKELVAHAIHDLSDRALKPFVPVSCSALPETLLESELFGHTRGSFTGAIANRRGLFEEANGGTLFLDEISTISPAIQVKLLRVLQERMIQRVGGGPPIHADFRLIAASNVDLSEEVAAGRLREDLYYRLNVFPIQVPPLRDRASDIPILVNHFRIKFSRENGVTAPTLSAEALTRLGSYAWPGNVRELENFIERAVIMHAGKRNVPFDPPLGEKASRQREFLRSARAQEWTLARIEREYILDVLESCDGHRARASLILGIDRRTLYRKLKEYGTALDAVDDCELD